MHTPCVLLNVLRGQQLIGNESMEVASVVTKLGNACRFLAPALHALFKPKLIEHIKNHAAYKASTSIG